MALWWQKNKENASYSHLHMDEPCGYMHVQPQIWGSDRTEELHIAKEINKSVEIPSPALNEKEAHADSARYLEIITLQMCSEMDASFGAALGTLNRNTFAQIITRTDSWNLLTIPSRGAATEFAVRDFCKSGNKSGHRAHTLLMSSRGFTSSPLLSWWIFQVAFWLVSALLVLLVQWPTTKLRADDAFYKSVSVIITGKESLGNQSSVLHCLFCVFTFSALLFSCGGEHWNRDLAQNFVTSQD